MLPATQTRRVSLQPFALLPLALLLALPALACERHLQGHHNGGTGTSQEASQR